MNKIKVEDKRGKSKMNKECGCIHEIGHPCNARFCWCNEHWEESQKLFSLTKKKLNENTRNKKKFSMNYIQKIRCILSSKIDVEDELLDLYSLLVLSKANKTTLEDVHNAWSIWRNNTNPNHKSLIPFKNLSRKIQKLDEEYAKAIVDTYKEL